MVATGLLTVKDLETMPLDDGRYELIDGELVEMPPSGGIASSVGARVTARIVAQADAAGAGTVFGADGGFKLFPDRETVRVPDVAFVSAERLPPPDQLVGFPQLAPDLVVEVLSPSERPSEVAAKVQMYLDAGVRMIWLVEPQDRTITVLQPGQPARRLVAGDTLTGDPVLPGFSLPVADIFR